MIRHTINKTGRKVISDDGNIVDEVTFFYTKPEYGSTVTPSLGVLAEDLPQGDSAVIHKDGQPFAVDYSKLRVMEDANGQ